MFHGSKYYAFHDEGKRDGALSPDKSELKELNESGYGIFFSVNSFSGTRKADNIEQINAWYCDIDGDKVAAMERIKKCPLKPSLINETKHGYHLFWLALDATVENYRDIEERLILYFKADDGAKDIARILRMPGYYHLKDPANPFLVRTLKYPAYQYLEREMLESFKPKPKDLKMIMPRRKRTGKTVLDQLQNYNCRTGLLLLSGTDAVNGDVYQIFDNGNGSYQIHINGSKSSSWIDLEGKIGSHKRPGPSLYQWLMWYNEGDIEKVKAIAMDLLRIKELA